MHPATRATIARSTWISRLAVAVACGMTVLLAQFLAQEITVAPQREGS